MIITRKHIAQKIIDYLYHRITLAELIDWAEKSMMEADFDEKDYENLKDITGRLGLADVKAFGITWEDCRSYLNRLGYQIDLKIVDLRAV
ncbi:hypothetical protein IT084_01045 [Desulfallas sp. Bu1-1]|uniref:hypothetical protein n=1 Tax=Desulfallas sp. Bu1-1 TaxID=2787620 RepID=UPI00189DBEDB|nr:hypothetical protein [Desulfallas sp. Bu1-1]MBF7081569.1 hypothetical protein [Desulfallas sp. Bu1-1]